MKTTRRISLGLSLSMTLASLAAGCAGEEQVPEAEESVASEGQAISGGVAITNNLLPYSAVVNYAFGILGCTATKIGPRRFITAAHCMVGVFPGVTFLLNNSLDGSLSLTDQVIVASVNIHPTWLNWDTGPDRNDLSRALDIATFTLTTDTPTIPAIGVRTAYVPPGTTAIVSGYGCDQIGNNSNRKQAALFTTGTLAQLQDRYGYELGLAWFTYNSATFQSNPRGCEGDSGGPMLMVNGAGNWEVAGIDSLGNDVNYTTHARVGVASKWVLNPTAMSFVNGSTGFFLNGKSNLCMGIDGASTANGALAAQFYCDMRFNGIDNQYWTLVANGTSFRIKNGKSGLCLGVDGASTANGARIGQYNCAAANGNNDNQAWRFTFVPGGNVQIRNAASNRCISVDNASTNRDALMLQFDCSNVANQGWIFMK